MLPAQAAPPTWHRLSLLLLPVVVTFAVPDWMYSLTHAIDAWVYHGFFRHLGTYASTMFPETYYGSRLGWIVPGYIAYHVFSPVAAALILHLTFYCAAVWSLYAIVRRIAGSSGALFSAVAFGLYLPAIRALGWDYVDGAVITYSLVTLALLLASFEENRRWLMFASGLAAGAMLHSNIGAAFLFPSILIWTAMQPGTPVSYSSYPTRIAVPAARSAARDTGDQPRAPRGDQGAEPLGWFLPDRTKSVEGGLQPARAWTWRSVLLRLIWWGAGITACTAMLSVVSVIVGGNWDFFMTSFRWMISQRLTNPWDVTGLAWIPKAPWFFLPASALVASLVVWLQPQRRNELTTGGRRAIASLALCTSIFAAWDYFGNGALLYTAFYTSWLLPWSFIAIGAVLSGTAERVRLDASIAAACAAAMVFSLLWPSSVRMPLGGVAGFVVTMGLMVCVGLARAVALRRLAILAALVCVHGWLSTTADYGPYPDRADGFRVIDRGLGLVDRYITESQPRFLLTPSQKLGHYVQGLTSIYLWGYTIASNQFPTVAPEQARQIRDGTRVIVIAEQENAAVPFDEVFASYGVRGKVIGSEQLMTQHGPLYLTFLEAIELPANDRSQSADSQTASPTPERP